MNTTALATIQPDEMDTIIRAGKMLAASGYFDGKGESNQAIAMMATKIMAGREIGIGPFASVNGIHIIKGRPSIGANLMAAAVKQSGRYNYRVRELTDKVCSIEYFEHVGDKWESVGVSTFTAEDARKAQTQNMDKYPRNMLFARAMSNGVRFYTPDIFGGNAVYVPEELGAEVGGDGNVVNTTFTVSQPEAQDATQAAPTSDNARAPQNAPQQPASAATEGVDNPFENKNTLEPWYVAARGKLTNGTAGLADKMLDIHRNGDGQCTEKQYQFLCGLIDSLPGVGKDSHAKVLSIICQSEISGTNRPSFDLAQKLLDYLPTHIKQDGNKVENPNYRQDVVDHIGKIANASQMTLPLAA